MASMVKKKRYWLALLLALFVSGALFLPFILSSSSISQFAASQINSRIPGNISIGSWMVGWQGVVGNNIVYEDSRKGIRVTLPRVVSTQGLIDLLFSPRNLGLVSFNSPVIELSGLQQLQNNTPATSGSGKTSEADSLEGAWQKVNMRVNIRDGMVKIGREEGTIIGIKNLNLHASVSSGNADVDIQFLAQDNRGEVTAKGEFKLPSYKKNFIDTLIADIDVSIKDFQLEDYLAYASEFSSFPLGEGKLTSAFKLQTVGFDSIELSGDAELKDIDLSGGFLGEDNPSLDTVSISLSGGEWSGLFWSTDKFQITSDAGSFTCSGKYRDNKMLINSKGNINVPVLFDLFPHLLRVQEEALIETGFVDFTGDLSMEGKKVKLDVITRLENLGGLFNGRPFVWDSPISAILKTENDGLDIRVNKLQIDAPFLEAYGQGDLRSFDLKASADIERMLAEFGKLFQHSWTGEGTLDLTMKADSPQESDIYEVNTSMNISRFTLNRFGKVVVPRHHFSVLGSTHIPLSLLKERKGNYDMQFALSTWFGDVFLAGNGQSVDGSIDTRFSTDSSIQLSALGNVLQAFGLYPEQMQLGGDMQIQAAGFVNNKVIGLDELTGKVRDFFVGKVDSAYHDKELQLRINRKVDDKIPSIIIHELAVPDSRDMFFRTGAGKNSIDFGSSGFFLHDIYLESDAGKVKVDKFFVENWRQPLDNLLGKAGITFNLDTLTPAFHNAGFLPPGDTLSGNGKLVFSAINKTITSELKISGFSLSRRDKQLVPKDDIQLTIKSDGPDEDGAISFKEIQFYSEPFDVGATGSVKRVGADRDLVLNGTFIPKLKKTASIVNNLFGVNVAMSGQQGESFSLNYRWPGATNEGFTDRFDFSSSLHAETLNYKGIEFESLMVPVELKNSRLKVDASGLINQGNLSLSTLADFGLEPPVLTISEKSQVVRKMQLEKPVVEGILHEIHPLFGVLASPSGQIDVTLDGFSWPIKKQGEQEAAFTSVFDISRVRLESSKMLRTILDSFNLNEEKLVLRDSELQCIGREGRIHCSPVRILVADSEMVVSGSVGMDKTLDYALEVPITEKLVGADMYQYLAGESVLVPISGTVDDPVFDKKKMKKAIEDIISHSAVNVIEKEANKVLPGLIEGVLQKSGKDK